MSVIVIISSVIRTILDNTVFCILCIHILQVLRWSLKMSIHEIQVQTFNYLVCCSEVHICKVKGYGTVSEKIIFWLAIPNFLPIWIQPFFQRLSRLRRGCKWWRPSWLMTARMPTEGSAWFSVTQLSLPASHVNICTEGKGQYDTATATVRGDRLTDRDKR